MGISAIVLTCFGGHSLTRRLPDGSWLRIVSTSYGRTNSYETPHPNRLQSYLLGHLPSSWSPRLGLWHHGGGVGGPTRDGETYLAVFTLCEQASPTSFRSSPQMDIFDGQTIKVGTAFPGATAGSDERQLVCWTLATNVPRGAKRLVLRFSELAADGETRQQVAEFVVPNPAARKKKHD